MSAVKTVGKSGQITLGKQYAGKQVLVDEIESGVWILKIGHFIPQNEQWLHQPDVKAELDQAVAWAESNPPQGSDLEMLEDRMS
ncbi:hypothetical protein SAMN06295888_12819 [Desulfonatronum zhilinae]|nr:hypothetical protein SAMN06295888_12819 [Desulfonatronum zhilinae]